VAKRRVRDPGRTADSFNLRHDPEPPHAASMSLWPQNPDESRRFTASCTLATGISVRRMADAVLAVDELTSNTVIHGGGFVRLDRRQAAGVRGGR
jgi:hypothetical protein